MSGEEGDGRPTRRVGAERPMGIGRGLEHVGETRGLASVVKPPELFDPAELLDVGAAPRHGRAHEAARGIAFGLEPVRGEIFGDAFGVPRRRVGGTERECEGVYAFVEQQMPPVVGIRLVHEPEAVGCAKSVLEVWHHTVDRQ